MRRTKIKPGIKIFLQNGEGKGLFGDGRFELLKEVRDRGSIAKASEALGRGYRKAWEDIRKMEEGFGRDVVIKSRGGSEGGSTRLTKFGLRLIELWEECRSDVLLSMNESFRRNIEGFIKKKKK